MKQKERIKERMERRKMKVSDYVMEFVAGLGVKQVFYVTGGGAMHLNDSLGRNPDLEGICMLHEQGASIAAEAYARIQEGYGVCHVTSGPGGTNAVTGVAGAWLDSIPVIFLSGQVKRADLVGDQQIRQFGIQEVDIVSIVDSITKYAVQIQEPEDIRYELEKAAALAVEGRPGPVWIDIPLDIQAAQIEPKQLPGYEDPKPLPAPCPQEDIQKVLDLLTKAQRPLLILGHGIRMAHAADKARELYEGLGIPVLTSWNGVDLIEEDHPLYFGRPGAVGHRSANFIQQKADLILTIGTRLNLLATGYNYEGFLKHAVHVMVDIDPYEMEKKSVHPQVKIVCDAGEFLRGMLAHKTELAAERPKWLAWCRQMTEQYPVQIPEQACREGYVSTYHLLEELSSQMTGADLYQFTSSGTTVDIAMKVFRIKRGQRAFLTKGLAAMGYDIPACIGSCIASGGRRTVCVTGDGSSAMNLQELEVIKRLQLPIKLFVADNGGYSMIYGSQNGNFQGNLSGCTKESGLTLPDMAKVAESFGIKGMAIESEDHLAEQVQEVLSYNGPVVCRVKTDIAQKVLPKQANYMKEDGQMASRPLEDMAPLLSREELKAVMKQED